MGRRSRSRRLLPALTARLVDVDSPLGEILALANRDRRASDAHFEAHPRALLSNLMVEERPAPRTPYSTRQFTTLSPPELPISGAVSSIQAPQRGPVALAYQANEFKATRFDSEIAEGEE